jgi:hypothetical protein
MGLSDDSDLKKALEKHSVSDIQALMSIHDVDINALDFQDASSNVVPLAQYNRQLIHVFRSFMPTSTTQVTPLVTGSMLISRISLLDESHVNTNYVGQLPTPTNIHPIPPTLSYLMDPVSLYKKGIKHDPNIFPIPGFNSQILAFKPTSL